MYCWIVLLRIILCQSKADGPALNREEKAPYVVFTEEHEKLKVHGEKWNIKHTHNCSITICYHRFCCSNHSTRWQQRKKWTPHFLSWKHCVFIIFAISNADSLFTSSTSLLVFFSILTSRYAQEDFLHTLPRSLIQGVVTLIISTVFMMFNKEFGQEKSWVFIPIMTMALLPIISFVLLQFPSLLISFPQHMGWHLWKLNKSNLLF